MSNPKPTKAELAGIDKCVEHFAANIEKFEAFAKSLLVQIQSNSQLMKEVHSLKHRVKDLSHLKDKLNRKLLEAKSRGESLEITPDNLFEKVNDLAGLRILHLHTMQIREIHRLLMDLFHEQKYTLIEEPTANCWDVEFENLFRGFGIATKSRDSMYTTIHYVLEANQRSKLTCEIQVRSLMDEVWGEVSHLVNYPHESSSQACQDQLKVLARLTSGGVRLVDSIFGTLERNES